MSELSLLESYFPRLTDVQKKQFAQLGDLYKDWNSKINVVSRKDIDNLYERHVLHSLAIAKIVSFQPGASVLDLGTGGGFPGIPLAILFPQAHFHLIDGTRKKIHVVNEVSQAVGLKNVKGQQMRAEELKKVKYDFVVTRAVAKLEKLWEWSSRLISSKHQHGLPNGLIALKGGTLKEEIKAMPKGQYVETFPINDFFQESAFADKYIVYVQGG
jgi:16S rRNA (guanine527-N7)-methyltransferase